MGSATVTQKKADNKIKRLPQWRVILQNDDINQAVDVAKAIVQITSLELEDAIERTKEAHNTGRSLLLVTHKEKAELYQEQFQSCHPPIQVELEPEEE